MEASIFRIPLPDDYEGSVAATLVRFAAGRAPSRAVLYLHGYVDYFFQTHMARWFVARGWSFYALDLRKYGRSLARLCIIAAICMSIIPRSTVRSSGCVRTGSNGSF